MKTNRNRLLFFAAVVLVAALLLWRWPSHRTVEPTPNAKLAAQSNSVVTSNINVVTQSIPPTLNATSEMRSIQAMHSKLEEFVQIYNKYHNIPIEFYGKIIDQNSNSVVGAKIDVTVRQQYAVSALERSSTSKEIPMEAKSGQDGLFVIRGEKGDSLHIDSIQKTEYLLSPKIARTYEYVSSIEPFHSDSQNPIVFRMWKLGQPQQLLHHYLSGIGISVDNTPVQFDLINGQKVSSGGQLIVRLSRNPQVIPPRSRYDWSLELEIPSGGLVANNDEFMYQAPDSGYQETFKFDMPKDAENWSAAINQQFYIELENEKCFGSLVVRLNTIHDTPPLGINLDIVINPSGSRSLQP